MVILGALLPALSKTKKFLVYKFDNQWAVLALEPNKLYYKVKGVFLLEKDAALFKKALKKLK